jgi:hypothetical protein
VTRPRRVDLKQELRRPSGPDSVYQAVLESEAFALFSRSRELLSRGGKAWKLEETPEQSS